MNEFSLNEGSVGKGIAASIISAVKYLIFPLLILMSATSLLINNGGGEVAEQLRLEDIKYVLLILGIPITILSFFRGFYPKGSISRFTFGAIITVLICLWIWMVTMGGNLILEFEQFGVTLNFTGLVLLFILAAALKGVYYFVEMLSYRREWLGSKNVAPVLGSQIVP
jgi:hypothetical protein